MKLENIKQIEQLVKLCRKTGVSKITVDGVTIELGEAPVTKQEPVETPDNKENPIYTDDDILNWSVNPVS